MDYKKEFQKIEEVIKEKEFEQEKNINFLVENFLKNKLNPPIKGKITAKKLQKNGLNIVINGDVFYINQFGKQISQTYRIEKYIHLKFLYDGLYEAKAKDLIYNEQITHLYIDEKDNTRIGYIQIYFVYYKVTIIYNFFEIERFAKLYIEDKVTQEKKYSYINNTVYLEILNYLKKIAK